MCRHRDRHGVRVDDVLATMEEVAGLGIYYGFVVSADAGSIPVPLRVPRREIECAVTPGRPASDRPRGPITGDVQCMQCPGPDICGQKGVVGFATYLVDAFRVVTHFGNAVRIGDHDDGRGKGLAGDSLVKGIRKVVSAAD